MSRADCVLRDKLELAPLVLQVGCLEGRGWTTVELDQWLYEVEVDVSEETCRKGVRSGTTPDSFFYLNKVVSRGRLFEC